MNVLFTHESRQAGRCQDGEGGSVMPGVRALHVLFVSFMGPSLMVTRWPLKLCPSHLHSCNREDASEGGTTAASL